MRGFDEARLVRIVSERLAQLADRALEHCVADEHVAATPRQQFLLRYQPPGLAGQELQQRKRLGRQRHRLVAPIQMPADRIEPEFGKRKNALGRSCACESQNLTESSPFAYRPGTISRLQVRITVRTLFGDSYMRFIHLTFDCSGPSCRCSGLAEPTGGGRRGRTDGNSFAQALRRAQRRAGACARHAAGAAPAESWRPYLSGNDQGRARAAVHEPGV